MSSDFSPDTIASTNVRKFPCKQCGGQLTYKAGASRLVCQHCEHQEIIPQSQQEIQEYAYNDYLTPPQATGWGTETRSIKCENCAATTTFQPGQIAAECAFCGSPKVVEAQANINLIRPESLIPFQVDKNAAAQKFREWLAGLWFRPSNLKKMAQLAKIKGLYLPFWTYDANTQSYWQAEAGYYYYVTETYTDTDANGNQVTRTRQAQRIRWEFVSGHHQAFFDDELVFASTGLPEDMVTGLYPYETQKLLPYEAGYLSGWLAEEYKLDVKQGWARGQEIIKQKVYGQCRQLVPGDTQRNLQVSTAFSNITYKHVLLPLWIAAYLYGGKTYRFLVNGQTGRVSGEAPLSWLKIILFVFALALIIGALVLIFGNTK